MEEKFEVHSLNIDLKADKINVALVAHTKPSLTQININAPLPTPGNMSEEQLKAEILKHVKQVLDCAIKSL